MYILTKLLKGGISLKIRPYLGGKNKISEYLRKSIYLSSLVMLIVSGYILFKHFVIDYALFNKNTSEIQNVWENTLISSDGKDEYSAKFNELSKINPDIKAWIKIDGTVINYPVLEPPTGEPTFYLDKNYKKEKEKSGSIFINSDICGLTEDIQNIVVHGHSMNNGTMFAALIHFSDIETYKRSPIVTFDTQFERAKWKIFAVIKTNSEESQGELFCDYFNPNFNSSYEFKKLIYDIKIRSLLDIPVDVEADDKILTMSTCSYEMKGFRTIVFARKVRNGESIDVDLDKVKVNNNPKMPDGWYKARQMKIPKFKTYEESLSNPNE